MFNCFTWNNFAGSVTDFAFGASGIAPWKRQTGTATNNTADKSGFPHALHDIFSAFSKVTDHLLGAFLACGFTWWIINRLRRILLSVNQGDAFEFANVKRLQAVGFGLLGIQLTALMLSIVAPQAIGQSASDYDFDLGSWLGILVVFILAEVFRQGSAMRDEQLTTV